MCPLEHTLQTTLDAKPVVRHEESEKKRNLDLKQKSAP